MEKNPEIVAKLAAERQDENWRFRTYMKASGRISPAKVDRLAEQFGREAEAQIDCTSCGACCRDNCVPVDAEEQARLARAIGISEQEFAEKYLGKDEDNEPAIEASPCPFLEANRCTVYEHRPEACRGYPYVGGNVSTRMIGIIERAGTCPIIYDMLERLKDALGFSRFR